MLYFFHHYELPVILQQAQLQQLLFRNHAQPTAQPATPSTVPTTPGPSPTTTPSGSPNPSTPTTEQTQQNYITELSQLDPEPSGAEAQCASSNTVSTTTMTITTTTTTTATTTTDSENNFSEGMSEIVFSYRPCLAINRLMGVLLISTTIAVSPRLAIISYLLSCC